MIELPAHIGRLRIVTMEQAALVMAGLSNEVSSVDEAINGNYVGWREAESYKSIISQAIVLKEITPIRAYTYPPEIYGEEDVIYSSHADNELMRIENERIDIDTHVVRADFLAAEIWPWVEKEINSGSSLHSLKPKFNDSKKNLENFDSMEWGKFAGKDTALMLIAGMAVALEKSGGKYSRGGKINKSVVAQTATDAINEYGLGTTITPKALTDLLKKALVAHVTKLDGE